MRKLTLALTIALLVPAAPAGADVFVSSQAGTGGVTGLVQLGDGGGETLRNGSGGAAIAGTGGGPIVYNSGGTGSIKRLSGNSYVTLATGVGSITSMTVTGRGLVVAKGNKLQYLQSNGSLVDVPHGTISDGPWVSITTEPNGRLLGWAWNDGWGSLHEFNLGTGDVTTQDFTGQTNDPLFDNRDNGFKYAGGPVANSGGISADGQGGIWLANGGNDTNLDSAKIYYAAPGGSFNLLTDGNNFNHPRVSATGDGKAYVSSTYTGPNEGHVYKFTTSGIEDEVTSSSGHLTNSNIAALAVDRCYTFCAISAPLVPNSGGGNAGGSTGTAKSPLKAPKTAKLGSKGLSLKFKCAVACKLTVTGKLVFGKAKKASAAVSNKLAKTKATLKAGKSKTIVLKLSKRQRKKVKKALHKKQKVTAKIKVAVKPKSGKAFTKPLSVRVK
jgi:hypothetical protein